MDAHGSVSLLSDLAVIIVAATISMKVSSVFKIPQLLGFIVVGILLSPVLGLIKSGGSISQLGELGVMFMMFFVGMEFNIEKLKKVFAPSILGIGSQIVAMGALGLFAARCMHMTVVDGIFLGGVLAMSSTIVIVEIFSRRGDLSKLYAQIAIGILIIEDIFAVFLLVVLSGLSSGQLPSAAELARSTLAILSFMITIFVIGKLVVPKALRKFASDGNRQELIMAIFCLIMGLGELAELSHLSLSLGAFMAGSVISGSDVSRRVEHITDPFRNLFVALFFVSVGTQINPKMILELWLPIVLISAGVVVFQTLACFCGIVAGGARCRDAYLAAVNKAQIGEFSFVIAGLGISSGVMNPSIMAIAMGVSFLTVFVNPLVSGVSDRVIGFCSRVAPKPLISALDVYGRFVNSVSKNASGSSKFAGFMPRFLEIFIYTLLFSAVMFVAAWCADWVEGAKLPAAEWIAVAVWVLAAAVSLPALAGVLKAVGNCAKMIVERGDARGGMRGGRLHAVLRAVFGAVIVALFALVYFAFVFAFLPVRNAVVILAVSLVLLAVFFRRSFSALRHSLEGRFSSVVKRHLENAESSRREQLFDGVKSSRSWARNVAEVEIDEFADAAGKSIAELAIRSKTGAEIAVVKRGRFPIFNITSQLRLYPEDVVVLCASDSQISEAEKILTRKAPIKSLDEEEAEWAGDIKLEEFEVAEGSKLCEMSLKQSELPRRFGVKVMDVFVGGSREPSQPDPSAHFSVGDKLLCMGSAAIFDKFADECGLVRADELSGGI